MFKPLDNSFQKPAVQSRRKIIIVALFLSICAIVVGTLIKLDKLGVQFPNGFGKDAAFGASFAPLGLLGVVFAASKAMNRKVEPVDSWKTHDPMLFGPLDVVL